jgi:hypothetical protein
MNIILDDTSCIEEVEVSLQGRIWQDLGIWDKLQFTGDVIHSYSYSDTLGVTDTCITE